MRHSFKLSKDEAQKLLIVILLICFSLGAICTINNQIVHICVIWFFAVCAILITKIDIMHPYTWFSLIFTLYSTAYAILLSMGLTGNYTREQLLFPALALGTSLLFIGPKKHEKNPHFLAVKSREDIDYKYLDIVILILFVLCLFFSIMLFRSGLTGKVQMKQMNNYYYRFGVYGIRYLTLFTIVRVCNRIRLNKKYIWCLLLAGIATVLFSFSTGERDTYIRFFVVVMFILYSAGIIKKRHFLFLIPISMILLALSVEFKYYFLRGTLSGAFSFGNILEAFLSSDFSAAGRNLQYLIDRPWTNGFFGMGMLFTEIFYPFLPKILITNPDYWFNYVVHAGGYHGNAFTMVGTGYIICGTVGIIIIFSLVGLLIKWLYKYSEKNTFFYSAYIYSITIIMISLRGSLNSIINSLFKEIGICFLFCYVINHMLSHKNKRITN